MLAKPAANPPTQSTLMIVVTSEPSDALTAVFVQGAVVAMLAVVDGGIGVCDPPPPEPSLEQATSPAVANTMSVDAATHRRPDIAAHYLRIWTVRGHLAGTAVLR